VGGAEGGRNFLGEEICTERAWFRTLREETPAFGEVEGAEEKGERGSRQGGEGPQRGRGRKTRDSPERKSKEKTRDSALVI